MDLKNIPVNSGVYIMKDKNLNIIYIGKAKNLKKRVSSYFNKSHNRKTNELVKNINSIEFFLCNNEFEAFILENNLIKKYMPKYNILLKDNKTYPYIKIEYNVVPKLKMTRKIKDDNSKYYGPYPNINMKNLLKNLIKIFNLKDCEYKYSFKNRKACLKFHMGLCNGICFKKDIKTRAEYEKPYKKLVKFLENKNTDIIKEINKSMLDYSKNLEFEKAIKEKEKLDILNKLIETQIIEITRKYDEDVFSVIFDENKLYLCVLIIREGKVIDKKISVFKSYIEDDNIENIVYMYYKNKNIPKKIILDENFSSKVNLLNEWLKKINKKAKIYIPKIKSRNKSLVELAKSNLIIEKEKMKKDK